MANVIRLKRGSGSDPAASDLVSGEPAVRTDTGELFFKKDDGSVAKVSGAGGGPDFKYLALRNAANNGAASYPNADFTLVTSGTTTALTPTAANTLLVSVNGVIQKPNTGTSTPSSGFALSGSTIKFGANLSAAPDFILYQESGGIGEPSDETVSEAKLKVSNSPVNGYFLSAQSGNNGGLTWAAPVATSCTGNSATATALATARTINGTSFDGTANITVTAAAGTLTGNTLNSSVTASSLTSLGDLSGITVTGDVVIADSIIHSGDTNTKIRFPAADTFSVETAGSERLNIDSDGDTEINSINDKGLFVKTNGNNASIRLRATGSTDNNGYRISHNAPNSVLQFGRVNSAGAFVSTLLTLGSTGDLTQMSGNLYIPNRIIHSGDTDTQIRFFSNDTITFEAGGVERLRIDNVTGNQVIAKDATASVMRVENSTAAVSQVAKLDLAPANSLSGVQLKATSEEDFSTGANRTAFYTIDVRQNGTFFERFRIDSSGRVMIGTTTEGLSSANDLTIGGSGSRGITIRSGTSNDGNLWFSDGTSGNAEYRGYVQYEHANDRFNFGTAATTRVTIDSSGHFLPATDSQYNIGSSSVRFANIYADTLYGDGSNLTGVSAGATGGGSDEVFYENSTTVTTSYSITSNKNAMSAGPISINNSVTVTVPSGSVWTIV